MRVRVRVRMSGDTELLDHLARHRLGRVRREVHREGDRLALAVYEHLARQLHRRARHARHHGLVRLRGRVRKRAQVRVPAHFMRPNRKEATARLALRHDDPWRRRRELHVRLLTVEQLVCEPRHRPRRRPAWLRLRRRDRASVCHGSRRHGSSSAAGSRGRRVCCRARHRRDGRRRRGRVRSCAVPWLHLDGLVVVRARPAQRGRQVLVRRQLIG